MTIESNLKTERLQDQFTLDTLVAVPAIASLTDDRSVLSVVEVDPTYDGFVKRLARDREKRTISNSSASHALSILRGVFRHAESYVKILSGHLEPFVYDDPELVRLAREFLGRSGNLEIVVQSPERLRRESSFVGLLTDDCKGRNQPNSIRGPGEGSRLTQVKEHILVSDDRVYRIEIDTQNHTAVGNFNDPARAVRLRSVFDSLFQSAQPIAS